MSLLKRKDEGNHVSTRFFRIGKSNWLARRVNPWLCIIRRLCWDHPALGRANLGNLLWPRFTHTFPKPHSCCSPPSRHIYISRVLSIAKKWWERFRLWPYVLLSSPTIRHWQPPTFRRAATTTTRRSWFRSRSTNSWERPSFTTPSTRTRLLWWPPSARCVGWSTEYRPAHSEVGKRRSSQQAFVRNAERYNS